MSDKAIYDRMSEEELAAVLRGDLQDENGLDMETLLYVMERYAHLQTVKPPKTFAPADSVTFSIIVGCRLPRSLPVPPKVTP